MVALFHFEIQIDALDRRGKVASGSVRYTPVPDARLHPKRERHLPTKINM